MAEHLKTDQGTPKGNAKDKGWPMGLERGPRAWFPAQARMIGLIRANKNSYVLPPAVVRKASWRE
jgi:hypothetical protein